MRGSSMHTRIVGLLCVVGCLSLPAPARGDQRPDFNGDGKADLAIGAPGERLNGKNEAGSVTILYGSANKLSSTDAQRFTWQDFGSIDQTGIHFGGSLAWGDFNGDTVTDLAIGASGKYAVVIMFGGPERLRAQDSQILLSPPIIPYCNSFGTALAAGNFDGDSYADLAVGAAGCDGDVQFSGVVQLYRGEAGALTIAMALHVGTLNSLGAPGDEFGKALAVGDFNDDGCDDLAVGIPNRELTVILSDVGAVGIFHGVPASEPNPELVAPVRVMYQENGGTHVNEAGDRFGSILASGDFNGDGRDDLAVGVPSEDVGGLVDAGEVTIYVSGANGLLPRSGHSHWNQDSQNAGTAIPDASEAGDYFGADLAVGDFNGDGVMDLAIGVPGEDLGTRANAGAVHVLYSLGLGGLGAAGTKFVHQDSSQVLDANAAGDAFGESFTAGDYDGNGVDDLAVGVPGEDILTVASGALYLRKDAGAVAVFYGVSGELSNTGNQFWSQKSAGVPGDPASRNGFGAGRYGDWW